MSSKHRQADRVNDMQVETAYDVLLMDNMKRRLSGEADVAKSVRFADVPRPKKKAQVCMLENIQCCLRFAVKPQCSHSE